MNGEWKVKQAEFYGFAKEKFHGIETQQKEFSDKFDAYIKRMDAENKEIRCNLKKTEERIDKQELRQAAISGGIVALVFVIQYIITRLIK